MMIRLYSVSGLRYDGNRSPLRILFGIKTAKCTFSIIIFLFLLIAGACSDGTVQNKHEPVKAHGNSDAHTSTYVCPMHCAGSGGNKAGVCPVCGMKYELLSEHMSNGHIH